MVCLCSKQMRETSRQAGHKMNVAYLLLMHIPLEQKSCLQCCQDKTKTKIVLGKLYLREFEPCYLLKLHNNNFECMKMYAMNQVRAE